MTPARKPRKKNTPEISTELIKRAAISLFAAKGYASTSLEEIAARARFTKGAIYYYFRSKEKLLLDILDDIEARSVAATARDVLSARGATIDLLVRFALLQARWASRNPDDLAILMLTSIESANKKGKVNKRVAQLYDRFRQTLETLLERARAAEKIGKDVSIEKFILLVTALHDGNMLLWYRSGLDPEVGRMLTRASVQTLAERFNELRREG